MIKYLNCKDVQKEMIFEAFNIGFQDYMVQLKVSMEVFFERFFGPEGNNIENSFIAIDGNNPVGLILGGIKEFDGLKTMRCGALCIDPNYRGIGVSKELFSLHKEKALNEGCQSLFLEVIKGNDRAIKFYEKTGYEKKYDIIYYNCNDFTKLNYYKKNYEVKSLNFYDFNKLNKNLRNIHINWQNDLDYLSKLNGVKYFGIFDNKNLMGSLAISPNGKVFMIYVEPIYRNKGVASTLLSESVNKLNLKMIAINYPDNIKLDDYLEKMGFTRNSLSQYEMYMKL